MLIRNITCCRAEVESDKTELSTNSLVIGKEDDHERRLDPAPFVESSSDGRGMDRACVAISSLSTSEKIILYVTYWAYRGRPSTIHNPIRPKTAHYQFILFKHEIERQDKRSRIYTTLKFEHIFMLNH